MKPAFEFKRVDLQDGPELDFQPSGVTCIVGANSSGKSRFLRELQIAAEKHQREASPHLKIIAGVTSSIEVGTDTLLCEWLNHHTTKEPDNSEPAYYRTNSGNSATIEHIRDHLQRVKDGEIGLEWLVSEFVTRISAGTLRDYVEGHLRTEAHAHQNELSQPILSKIHTEPDLEHSLQELTRSLFGSEVFLDRINFPPRMRTTTTPNWQASSSAFTRESMNALAAMTPLDEEGDGLRSFVGLAAIVLGTPPDVLLLDEPDSFLHPAQARAVGKWMAGAAQDQNIQIVVSTHNSHFLAGLIEGAQGDCLTVIRITRSSSDISTLDILTPTALSSLWQTPALKYSNVLDGVFYKKVVLCEADDDCRFYNAAMETALAKETSLGRPDDALFLSAHGNSGVPELALVLQAFGVHISAIVDFDTLQNESLTRAIVEKLGGDWSEISKHYDLAVGHVRGYGDVDKWWKDARTMGMAKVPSGSATQDFSVLIERLVVVGLHVISGGALESFYKSASKESSHGWLREALNARAYEFHGAQALITTVLG